jgi:hypothetical protein
MPMPVEKKEFEDELTVINVSLRGNTVILNLRFTKPRVEDTSKLRPENIVEPLSQSETERMARQVARGTMQAIQKQMQQQMRVRFLPPTSPFDAIQIVLSKQEYLEIGRPTVDDKLTLKLRMK